MWESIIESDFVQIQSRLAVAAFCGLLVGLERGYRGKPAGLRTHILISVGAALFMVLSIHVAEAAVSMGYRNADPARIAAQIVTGIGFLGAGAIIQNRGLVLGLTSAATIWCMAAIGMAAGAGMHWTSLASSLGIIVTLETLVILERTFRLRRFLQMTLDIAVKKEARVQQIRKVLRSMDVTLSQERVENVMGETHYRADIYMRGDREEALVQRIEGIKGVQDVTLLSQAMSGED
ncbi:MAG: MgtC/SapB family protein [Spirochaetales bacterium]|nr:MgtC/SapB family protein [Leptospiraceae bacterium]MCP5483259.1 MgtC/SapB family protein [Spirochaetales bacterium]